MQYFTAIYVLLHLSRMVQSFDNIFVDDEFEQIDDLFFNATNGLHQNQVETHWFKQPLDHFNPRISPIWKMRYLRNLEFWKPGGPVIVIIGGEGKIHPYYLLFGLAYDLAAETNGALFNTEHRYYGESIPSNDLRYLSSIQAIADLAEILRWLKSHKQLKSSKVVLVGGSYAGNLAVWTKRLYPNLVDAALASSAPILAKLDYFEYLETVGNNYKKYGTQGCYNFVQKQFNSYTNAFKTIEGIQKLKNDENICEHTDMSILENQQTFIWLKLSPFTNYSQSKDVQHIKKHCNQIMTSPGFSKTNSPKPLDTVNRKCYDFNFYRNVEGLRNSTEYYKWFYQKCTEFSYFKTSSTSNKHPFTPNINIKTFYKICTILFGDGFNAQTIGNAVKDTNTYYGGWNPKVKNVIFTNGELDPWHRLGVLKDLSKDAPAIFIPKVSHCKDLDPELIGDPKELRVARKIIKQILKNWIVL